MGGMGSDGGWAQVGGGVCGFRWGGMWVQVGGGGGGVCGFRFQVGGGGMWVQVGWGLSRRVVFRWRGVVQMERCSGGEFSEGGSKGANFRGIEGEQRDKRWGGGGESSTESFCNLSLGFEMD